MRPAHVYWGGLTSATHLLYGTSWLRRFTEGGREADVLVEGFGSFLGRRRLTWDDVAAAAATVPGVRVRPRVDAGLAAPRDADVWYLTVGAPGIKPRLRLTAANPLRQISTVITDEGFSSYGTWVTRRASWLREGRGVLASTAKALIAAGSTAASRPQRWLLHTRGDEGWSLNPWIASEFRSRVTRSAVTRTAIFCSQPWVELGLVPAAEYTAHVLTVAETCRNHGLAFVLRPHPAEDISRYPATIQVRPGDSPVELDGDAVNAAVAIGASSSALINLSALHGVPAVRVSPPQIAQLDTTLSPAQRSLLATYLGPDTPLDLLGDRLPGAPRG